MNALTLFAGLVLLAQVVFAAPTRAEAGLRQLGTILVQPLWRALQFLRGHISVRVLAILFHAVRGKLRHFQRRHSLAVPDCGRLE